MMEMCVQYEFVVVTFRRAGDVYGAVGWGFELSYIWSKFQVVEEFVVKLVWHAVRACVALSGCAWEGVE